MQPKYLFLISFLLLSITVSAQKVYITKSGTKYHNADCKHLKKSRIEIDLQKAMDKGYTACSRYSDIKSTNTTVKKDSLTKPKLENNSVFCKGTTQEGKACKRKASKDSNYCWQHKKKVK
jgi:hypothetical protein